MFFTVSDVSPKALLGEYKCQLLTFHKIALNLVTAVFDEKCLNLYVSQSYTLKSSGQLIDFFNGQCQILSELCGCWMK